MITFLMIIGAAMIVLGVGLMRSNTSDMRKPSKPKKRRKEKGLFFGTPLERF